MEFHASELRLRGNDPVIQPHSGPEGNLLCWNGEIFEGLQVDISENDGSKLYSQLQSAKDEDVVIQALGRIEGPYAMVYYQKSSGRIFFARDPLGRRSLLVHYPTAWHPYFLLTSVSLGRSELYELQELSTGHINVLDISSLVRAQSLHTAFDDCIHDYERDVGHAPWAAPSKLNQTLPLPAPEPLVALAKPPPHAGEAALTLHARLSRSVELRVSTIPPALSGQARVAILFSGGIDSAALAFYAHQHVPKYEPIDLLNVAFENPRKQQKTAVSFAVPDRVTGVEETAELRKVCPGRAWNFVEIDVPYSEAQAMRPTVEALMHPCETVMDLSLAIALYFAARGRGQIRLALDAVPTPYESHARVLLNGLGADELLGGYGRHRTTFKHGSWPALIHELQLDLDRIPTRNLGRDDRIISSHGKEGRHPFLSLDVVNFVAELPVHVKTDPRAEQGLGDKMLLRIAMMKAGMVEASTRKKRAMQFGSHSARMEEGGPKKGDIRLTRNVAHKIEAS